ncbi:GA module-containing protein [Mycoplasmopsis iners]|uniref:GA module-containing protein n=1 Tax=Mycoplasmopsis iners TaxID=76630 RepID=UPI000497DC41|nr:GA module-containing protein [Mycoplasmopsis iners]
MSNKKFTKKLLTIGAISSPLLLFLPSALTRVDNEASETGNYDQTNIFSTSPRNTNSAVEKYQSGSWSKEVWGKVDRTWQPKTDQLKPETIMEVYENGRWVELQDNTGRKTIWNPSDDATNALNPNFVKKIRLRYLSMKAYQNQDSMGINQNYFSGGFWFSKDIVLASNIDVKVFDARKSEYKTSPKLERHETIAIDPFSFSYTSQTDVSPTVISNTVTADGTSEESVSKQFSSRYNAFYTENPLTGTKNTSRSKNSEMGTNNIIHDLFKFDRAAFLNKYAQYKPDNGLYNDAESFTKLDGWMTIYDSLGGYFYFASGRGTVARPQEVVLEFDVKFNINSDGTTTNDFDSTTRSFFGTTQAYYYDNQRLLQKFSMQKPSLWRNNNLIIKEEYDERVKKLFNTLNPNAPQAEFYLVNTKLNSSKDLNDSDSVVKISRSNISKYSDFSKPFTNKTVIQEPLGVDSTPTTPSTWQASNIELVIKQDEQSKKYWKFANKNGRFTLSDRYDFSSDANINSNVVWSLTDYGLIEAKLNQAQWLTKSQKEKYLADLEANNKFGTDWNLVNNDLDAQLKAIDDLDEAQKTLENNYYELLDVVVSDNALEAPTDFSGLDNFSWKQNLYLADNEAKTAILDTLKEIAPYAFYDHADKNTVTGKAMDRTKDTASNYVSTDINVIKAQNQKIANAKAKVRQLNGLDNFKTTYLESLKTLDLTDPVTNSANFNRAIVLYKNALAGFTSNKYQNIYKYDFASVQNSNSGLNEAANSDSTFNQFVVGKTYLQDNYLNQLKAALTYHNETYLKAKKWKSELDDAKLTDNYAAGKTLATEWEGNKSRDKFTKLENIYNGLIANLEGTNNTENQNVLAALTNVFNETTINIKDTDWTNYNKYNAYRTNLVSAFSDIVGTSTQPGPLNLIFGNGGKLAQKLKEYQLQDADTMKKYFDFSTVTDQSNLGWSFTKLDLISVDNTKVNNLLNWTFNETNGLEDASSTIDAQLLKISNHAYKDSADKLVKYINGLSYIYPDFKKKLIAEVNAKVEANKGEIYKNDSDLAAIKTKADNLEKEIKRINDLASSLATENSFGYTDKENTLATEAVVGNITYANKPENTDVNFQNITKPNNITKSIAVDFNVSSTLNQYAGYVLQTVSGQTKITNFSNAYNQEAEALKEIAKTLTIQSSTKWVGDSSITASDDFTFNFAAGKENKAEVTDLSLLAITNAEYKNGSRRIKYTLVSKTYPEVSIVVDPDNNTNNLPTSAFTGSNFQNEYDRINALNPTLTPTSTKTYVNELNATNFASSFTVSGLDNTKETFAYLNAPTWDLRDGSATLSWKITSAFVDDAIKQVESAMPANTFKTEQERVDAILADSNNLFTINESDADAIDRNQLPSKVAKEAIKAFNNPANLDVQGDLSSIELLPNNDNGTLDITFKIASTKATLNSNNDAQNPVVVSTGTRTITLTGFKSNLQVEKDKVTEYINNNVPEDKKAELLDELNRANTIEEVKAVQLKAEIEKAIADATTNYPYLNNNQLEAYKTDLKSAASSQAIQARSTTASTLNAKMKELSNAVKTELTALTKKAVENDQNKDAKTAVVYTLADANKKQAYDNALSAAQTLLNKTNGANSELSAVETVLSNLKTPYGELNGDQNQNALNQRINALNNLTPEQKAQLKKNIANADTQADAETIVEAAEALNTKITNVKEELGKLDGYKNNDVYKLDKENKGAYDTALENLQDALDDLSNKDLTSVSSNDINNEATTLDTKVNEANQAKGLLDGIRSDLKDKLNNFDHLTPANKEALINLINADNKELSAEKVADYLNQALNLAKTNINDEIDKLTHLTPAEKQAYKDSVKEAKLNTTEGEKYDKNINDILAQAKADEATKTQAIETINNLTNLNPAQKSALTKEVKNNPTSKANNIVEKAKAIDEKMKAYKEITEVDKQSTDYVEADEDHQVKYNNQVAIRAEDLGANGTNLSANQIDAKIAELNSAINGLNGDEKVAKAKENAIAKIEGKNPSYTNLTDQQKAEAIAKINEKNRIADVNDVDANNALVNGTMATLDTYLNNETKIKNDINYTGSEEALRKAYDDAIQALKDYKTALNEPSDDTKDILNNDKIEEKINAVHEAINNLNGKEHIQTVRAEEIAKINALENINDAQKLALIAKVDKATTPEDVRAVTEEAKALDNKMAELKQAVADNQDTPNSVDYKNATKEKMREFDEAFNDASNLANKENGSAELSIDNIDSLINKLNLASQNLDGAQNINDKKAEAKNLINGLEHLNDAQKTALIEEIDNADLLANVKKVVDQAKTLNNAMGQLKETVKAIDDELSQPDNPKYVAASEELKANYDEAKAKVDELISKQGSNEDVAEVLELEKALIDAKNALDGDKNFEYAKEKAIEKVNKNDQLTPEEKQKLIDQIKETEIPENSNNEDEVDQFKEDLDEIVDKADLINKIKENENLTPDQKEDLIEDVINANVDDKKNELEDKNTYDEELQNIKDKEKAFEDLNKTPESELSDKDKAKINNDLKDLDPADKDFDEELANEEKKKEAIEEVRKNPNLTDEEKTELIDEIANLDNKQDDLDNSLANIDKKADLIEKIESNPNLDEEDKNKLVDEVFNVPHNDEKLDEKLDNIDNKLELIDEITTNDKLDETSKDKLIEKAHNVNNDSEKADDELENIKAKEEAINKVVASDELTPDEKAKLVEEILDVDETNTPSEVNDQLHNIDKKAELHKEINNSDLSADQKTKLIEELDPVDSNNENAVVIFDKIRDQLNQLDKINKDETLKNDDKTKLVEDVLNNNPNDENYYETAKNIDKKQDAIDAIRQNENLTNEQKDQISNNIASLDEESENFNNDLAKENAKAELIANIQGNENIKDDEKVKLVDKVEAIDNSSDDFFDELVNKKAESEFIAKVNKDYTDKLLDNDSRNTLINKALADENAAPIVKLEKELDLIEEIYQDSKLPDEVKKQLTDEVNKLDENEADFAKQLQKANQKYVDVKELIDSLNALNNAMDKPKQWNKFDKTRQTEIKKAIDNSNNILNSLSNKEVEEIANQTQTNKALLNRDDNSKDHNWILFAIALTATLLSLGLLIAVPGIRKKLFK